MKTKPENIFQKDEFKEKKDLNLKHVWEKDDILNLNDTVKYLPSIIFFDVLTLVKSLLTIISRLTSETSNLSKIKRPTSQTQALSLKNHI